MKNITIISEDRVGVLADITEIMAKAEINIDTITSEKINDLAVITMTVDRNDDALRSLANSEFQAIAGEVVLIKLVDKPGALAELAGRFKEANINMHSLKLIRRQGNLGIAAISCSEPDRIRELLKDQIII